MNKEFVMKSPRQENGIWGMPFEVYKIDKIVMLEDEIWLLHSALLMGMAEKFPNHHIEIWGSTKDGFIATIKNQYFETLNQYTLKYNNYKLIDNCLYYLTDREAKIERLQNGL